MKFHFHKWEAEDTFEYDERIIVIEKCQHCQRRRAIMHSLFTSCRVDSVWASTIGNVKSKPGEVKHHPKPGLFAGRISNILIFAGLALVLWLAAQHYMGSNVSAFEKHGLPLVAAAVAWWLRNMKPSSE